RELTDSLAGGRQNELIKALSKMNAGRIQVGTGVGVTANVIIAEPWGEGGQKLTVFYERNLRFYELRYGTRSEDYPIDMQRFISIGTATAKEHLSPLRVSNLRTATPGRW